MQSNLLFIIKNLGQFLICAATIALLTGLIFVDIQILENGVQEASLTELAQEVILVAIVVLHGLMMRIPALRHSSALIGGFFVCMLCREMDFAFDVIRHGFWVWVALAVALSALAFAASNAKNALAGLTVCFKHPSYGMLSAGLLTILLFARLIGMGELWQSLLADNFVRTVKNAVEEGTELLGYGLCLLATLSYTFDQRRCQHYPVKKDGSTVPSAGFNTRTAHLSR